MCTRWRGWRHDGRATCWRKYIKDAQMLVWGGKQSGEAPALWWRDWVGGKRWNASWIKILTAIKLNHKLTKNGTVKSWNEIDDSKVAVFLWTKYLYFLELFLEFTLDMCFILKHDWINGGQRIYTGAAVIEAARLRTCVLLEVCCWLKKGRVVCEVYSSKISDNHDNLQSLE